MSHIMVWRGPGQEDGLTGFWHHGIQTPTQTVIHYTGMAGPKTLSDSTITETSLQSFHLGSRIHTVRYSPTDHTIIHPPEQILRRARSKLGHSDYNLLFHNCESFARWCVVGDHVSFQTRGYLVGAALGLASLAFGGGLFGAALTVAVFQKVCDRRANQTQFRVDAQPTLSDNNDSDFEE